MANIGQVVTVTIDGTDKVLDPGLITAVPDANIVFVFVNNGTTKHRVSISPFTFKKKKPSDKDGPIDPFALFWTDVEKNDMSAIVLRIRPKSHFGGPGHRHEYKYDISSSNFTLDPDIQIDN